MDSVFEYDPVLVETDDVAEEDLSDEGCQVFWTVLITRLGSRCWFVVPMLRLGFGSPGRNGDGFGCTGSRCIQRLRGVRGQGYKYLMMVHFVLQTREKGLSDGTAATIDNWLRTQKSSVWRESGGDYSRVCGVA